MQVGILIDPSLENASQLTHKTVSLFHKHFPSACLWTAVMSKSGVKFITPLTDFTEYCSKLERVLAKREDTCVNCLEWVTTEKRLLGTWQGREVNCAFRFVHIKQEGDFWDSEGMIDYFLKNWPLQQVECKHGCFLINQSVNFDAQSVEESDQLTLDIVETKHPITWISKPLHLKSSVYYVDEQYLYLLAEQSDLNYQCCDEFKKLLLTSYFKEKKPLERTALSPSLKKFAYKSLLIYSKDPFVSALSEAIYNNTEHCKALLDQFKTYFTTYSVDMLNGEVERYLGVWEELRLLGLVDYDPFPISHGEPNPRMNASYLKLQCSNNAIYEDNITIKRKSAYSLLYRPSNKSNH